MVRDNRRANAYIYGAICPCRQVGAALVMETANTEFPPIPEFTVNSFAVHTAFFFSAPGSVHAATRSGTWGEARGATVEMGEKYLQICVQSTLAVLDNIERTFAAMPLRQ